jgi:hypothetical protein
VAVPLKYIKTSAMAKVMPTQLDRGVTVRPRTTFNLLIPSAFENVFIALDVKFGSQTKSAFIDRTQQK